MKSFATHSDLKFLQARGISADEAQRQWDLLNEPPPRIVLARPCTVGDGIEALSSREKTALFDAHRNALQQGRWTKFVPASGAASRMFVFEEEAEEREFCESLHRFAFLDRLESKLAETGRDLTRMLEEGRYAEIIETVLDPAGLGYAETPKGLIEFHRYEDHTRCAFEEHLLEALLSFGDRDNAITSHFTVSAEHREAFQQRWSDFLSEPGHDRCRADFSVQHPSTETIAKGADGRLLRTGDDRPVLRPGGHGALIENLNDLQGDLIFIKNIDNVCHGQLRDASVKWIQLLGGYLVRLQDAVHEHLRSLKSGDSRAVTAAADFLALTFSGEILPDGDDPDTLRAALIQRLSRPLRVCGMVPNEGEPGGGPFWVRQSDGRVSVQIVEEVEIDKTDDSQAAALEAATHFNPVFMALAVRDENGSPYDLRRFVDQRRAIITSKPVSDQVVTVLERPGLWNGAMAGWNSLFVETPIEVFSPVKRVFDLLRDEHQACRSQVVA